MASADGIRFGKPASLTVVCPRCLEPSHFPILMLGDIIARKIVCHECKKTFLVWVKWEPTIRTERDINDG